MPDHQIANSINLRGPEVPHPKQGPHLTSTANDPATSNGPPSELSLQPFKWPGKPKSQPQNTNPITLEEFKKRRTSAIRRRKEKEERILQLERINETMPPRHDFNTHFVLTIPGVNIETELNCIKANKILTETIGHPKKISKMNRNSLLIVVTSKSQGDKLQTIRELCNNTITIQPHRTLNSIRGTVLSPTMAQSTDEEILDQLSGQGVIKVERMKRRHNEEFVNTNRFILTFSGTHLPSLINITPWQRELVEPYIPKPLRCNKCQRLGHTKNWCRHPDEKKNCSHCSQPGHVGNTCTNDPFCINCEGPHPPTSKQCDQYKYRLEVLTTQVKNHITRKEAEDLVRLSFRTNPTSYRTALLRNLDNDKNTRTETVSSTASSVETSTGNSLNSHSSTNQFSTLIDLAKSNPEEETLPDLTTSSNETSNNNKGKNKSPSKEKVSSTVHSKHTPKKTEPISKDLPNKTNVATTSSKDATAPTRKPQDHSKPKTNINQDPTSSKFTKTHDTLSSINAQLYSLLPKYSSDEEDMTDLTESTNSKRERDNGTSSNSPNKKSKTTNPVAKEGSRPSNLNPKYGEGKQAPAPGKLTPITVVGAHQRNTPYQKRDSSTHKPTRVPKPSNNINLNKS